MDPANELSRLDAAGTTGTTQPRDWRASSWNSRRRRTLLVAGAIVVFSTLVGVVAGDWIWGAGAAVVLALCLLDAFVPLRYATDEKYLLVHGALRSRRVAWADVVRVGFEADGAYLSTRGGRGLTVLLDSPARGPWLAERVRARRLSASQEQVR